MESKETAQRAEIEGGLLALTLIALLVGIGSGLVGATFRLLLSQADRWRDALILRAHAGSIGGLAILLLTCVAATALAARLVRRYSPFSAGSGITHVEVVLNGDLPPAPVGLVPVKFGAGLLALGSGLALGPEGPNVQMGGSIGHFIGRVFRRSWPDRRVLMAAGAGAGLAAAFNAPIAGAVFALEDLVRHLEIRIAIVVLGASATGLWIGRMLLGSDPEFHLPPLHFTGTGSGLFYLALGMAAGLLGAVYNRTIIGALEVADRFSRCPVEVRAALIGAGVTVLAFFGAGLVGSGYSIIQQALDGSNALFTLLVAFLIRFALGPISYAAGTPGGLLLPMLTLGAQLGIFFGLLCRFGFPTLGIQPEGFAVVGMAAFYTAASRNPLTAIVLVTEMTAASTMLMPMLIACFAAMTVPTLLGSPAIDESLQKRTLRIAKNNTPDK